VKEARAGLVKLRGESYPWEEELLYLERSDAFVPDKPKNCRYVQ
jgi:hypothetical protein